MKITDIETVVVTVPLIAPIRVSQGVVPGSTRTVIKVHTDEKVVGVGETVGGSCGRAGGLLGGPWPTRFGPCVLRVG